MIKKMKEYLEYKKNRKMAKTELAKVAAATLPVIREVSGKTTDIARFVIKLANETKNIEGEKLIQMILNELSVILQTNNNRIIEILTYMANLNPDEIQKILVHSAVETMPNVETTK